MKIWLELFHQRVRFRLPRELCLMNILSKKIEGHTNVSVIGRTRIPWQLDPLFARCFRWQKYMYSLIATSSMKTQEWKSTKSIWSGSEHIIQNIHLQYDQTLFMHHVLPVQTWLVERRQPSLNLQLKWLKWLSHGLMWCDFAFHTSPLIQRTDSDKRGPVSGTKDTYEEI